MIIIVDSIDRVGKSTLANKLVDALGAKIYKHSEKNKDYSKMTDDAETSAMLAMIDLYKLNQDNAIIFDRFHLSNTVYGILNRGYYKDSAMMNFDKIDASLSELDNVYLIKVNPTDIKRSSAEHGSDLSEHMNMFNMLYDRSNIKNKIECDYNSIDDIVESISDEVNAVITDTYLTENGFILDEICTDVFKDIMKDEYNLSNFAIYKCQKKNATIQRGLTNRYGNEGWALSVNDEDGPSGSVEIKYTWQLEKFLMIFE